MNLISKKIIYFGLLFGGVFAFLVPILTVMNNKLLIVLGIAMMIGAGIFAAGVFRCAVCREQYIISQEGKQITYAGGFTRMLGIARIKKCPHCGEVLR